ncbi:MAG TPA: hypothetical protein VFG04_04405 [Planctomycetaceae bacterium]|nr:hypothetical protein [Planctomycetaceae bacterium]
MRGDEFLPQPFQPIVEALDITPTGKSELLPLDPAQTMGSIQGDNLPFQDFVQSTPRGSRGLGPGLFQDRKIELVDKLLTRWVNRGSSLHRHGSNADHNLWLR